MKLMWVQRYYILKTQSALIIYENWKSNDQILSTLTPFHLNIKRLFLIDSFYIPLRYGICIFVSLIIFMMFMVNIFTTYESLKSNSEILAKLLYSSEGLAKGMASIKRSMDISLFISLTLFVLMFFFIQINVLVYIKNLVLKFRKGEYMFKLKGIHSYDGINLIASFVANTFFSLYVFFFFLLFVITPICFNEFWMVMWGFRKYWLMQVVLVMFNIGLHIVLAGVFTDGYHIRFRFCYQMYEIYKMIIGFIVSMVIGAIRYVLLVFFVIMTLFRVDSSITPVWVNKMFHFNFDFVNYRFQAFIKSYHHHNNPIVHTFTLMLQAGLFKKKERERGLSLLARDGREAISHSQGVGTDVRQKNSRKPTKNNTEEIAFEKIEKVPHSESDRIVEVLDTGLGNSEMAFNFDKSGEPVLKERKSKEVNRRIAAKWQLCVLLAMNPSLMRYRVSDSETKNQDRKRRNFYDKDLEYQNNVYEGEIDLNSVRKH